MRYGFSITVVAAAAAWLAAYPRPAPAQQALPTIVPHPAWDCGMPDGIPQPERGNLIFEISLPLERVVDIGTTQYGERRVAIGLQGVVEGPELTATVVEGALDLELELSNGAIEIEQILVFETADGSYILARNAGTGSDSNDIRVVMDFEAPNDGAHAWLNSGSYVARRDLNREGKTMRIHVYDVSGVSAGATQAIHVSRPTHVPFQSWGYRKKASGETQGEVLITENVTLAPSQRVGPSKRGPRNIIPITGGQLSGRINGKVLMGGADYQNLTPPATIDARYLWQTDDGEIIVVRNGGEFGSLVPTFETRVDGPYAFLNDGLYLSSNPGPGQGGVALIFYDSTN